MTTDTPAKTDPKQPSDAQHGMMRVQNGAINTIAAGLAIQTYCNSVLIQPDLKLVDYKNLEPLQTKINDQLGTAKKHANNYLKVIQPDMIKQLANMESYFETHQAIKESITPNMTLGDIEAILSELHQQASSYAEAAKKLADQLDSLHKGLSTDAANFSEAVTEFNAKVKGDKGALEALTSTIHSLDKKMTFSVIGGLVSGLVVVAGIGLMIAGAALELPSAGTSTALIVGGMALFAGGGVGVGVALAKHDTFVYQKQDAIEEQTELKAEVKQAAALQTHFNTLTESTQHAQSAVSSLADGWDTLVADLETRLEAIHNAKDQNTRFMMKLLIGVIDKNAHDVLDDIATIKHNLGVVKTASDPSKSITQLAHENTRAAA